MDANESLFYTSLYTFLGGFVLALAGLIYKSKCKNIKCCGLCEIERDIDIELQEDLARNPISIDRQPN